MSKLEQAIKNYDSAIDEYYADGFYPSVQEQKEINDLQYEVLKEVRNSIIELNKLEVLKQLLLIEVREIGGKYYIKYFNIEDGNYIEDEISKEMYEVLK